MTKEDRVRYLQIAAYALNEHISEMKREWASASASIKELEKQIGEAEHAALCLSSVISEEEMEKVVANEDSWI